jgi:hypothetical protein
MASAGVDDDAQYEAARRRARRLAGLAEEGGARAPPTAFSRYVSTFEALDGTTATRRGLAGFLMSFTILPFLSVHACVQLAREESLAGMGVPRPGGGGVGGALSTELVSQGCRLATTRFVPLSLTFALYYGLEYTARTRLHDYILRAGGEALQRAREARDAAAEAAVRAQLDSISRSPSDRATTLTRGAGGAGAGLLVAGLLRVVGLSIMRPVWTVPAATLGLALGAVVLLPDWEKLPVGVGGGGQG